MSAGWTVYRITCAVDGRRYIGITSNLLSRRWTNHQAEARRNSRAKGPLQIALRQHGASAFRIEVICEVADGQAAAASERALIAAEATLWPGGYNGTTGGDVMFTVSALTRARMSAAGIGRPKSTETRTRMRAAQRRRSAVTQAKIVAALRGQKRTAEQLENIRKAAVLRAADPAIRAAMIERLRSAPRPNVEAIAEKNRGQTRTPETRAKIAASSKAAWAKRRAAGSAEYIK